MNSSVFWPILLGVNIVLLLTSIGSAIEARYDWQTERQLAWVKNNADRLRVAKARFVRACVTVLWGVAGVAALAWVVCR